MREKRALYLKDVADEVGCTIGHLSNIEKRKRSAGLKLNRRLARFFETSDSAMRALTRSKPCKPTKKR